ncbi:RidA family protein [Candidatus Sumerlaeota bacterium]|nr:RidA family protein [Candidatus Sumerlaeota bacterium]
MGKIDDRLRELGIALPDTPRPVAAYVPAVQTGNLVFTAGQIPLVEGKLCCTGTVGRDLTLEQGTECARICALNALAAIRGLIGDLDRIERVVKINGWVASADDFTDQPRVMNGASELIAQIFGEAGQHARAALGVNALPLGAPVEVEMIVQISG